PALRVALAEACYADGDASRGDAELRACMADLKARAAVIPDEAARARFLGDVPENVRARRLAGERLGELGCRAARPAGRRPRGGELEGARVLRDALEVAAAGLGLCDFSRTEQVKIP